MIDNNGTLLVTLSMDRKQIKVSNLIIAIFHYYFVH